MIARGVHCFWRLILFPCSLHQDKAAYLEVDRVYSFLTCDRTLAYLREVAESDTRDEQDPNTITKRAHATSSQATVQTRRVTLAAQPEYPPPFFRLRRSSAFREFFTEESDAELWAAFMQGETNISAKAKRQALFLRPESSDLPAEMSSWTLQTYLTQIRTRRGIQASENWCFDSARHRGDSEQTGAGGRSSNPKSGV